MALVNPSTTDQLLSEVATADSVTAELSGSPDLPPLPASRTVDGAANGILTEADGSAFSANLWSASMPHGFALCAD